MSDAPAIVAALDRELAERWPERLTRADLESLLIRAIHARQVAECARALLALPGEPFAEGARAVTGAAVTACEAIRTETIAEQSRIVECCTAAGIPSRPVAIAAPARMQFHSFEVVVDPADVESTLAITDAEGFHRWAPSRGGGWESYRRSHAAVTLIKTDEVTTRMILRWAPRPAPSRYRDWFLPTTLDYRLVELPAACWPVYHLLRPLRIALERIAGGGQRRTAWPFLGTPSGVVEPLLELAGVTADDRIVDLGCGDGRILIQAARLRGCRGHGIEQDPIYVELARQRTTSASVGDRVIIEAGDATRFDVGDATVVFLFLPPDAVRRLLPSLLGSLRPGARILTHEQLPLADGLMPERSRPLFATNAMTVGHLWTVGP